MKTKIAYKSKLSRFKNIEKRNAAFDALPDEDKRKEIAWDSLQLILAGKTSGAFNNYWSTNLFDIDGDSKTLQKALIEELPTCDVCARGAMMLSQIRLGNSIDSSDINRENGEKDNIKGFSIEDFESMEREYEFSCHGCPYDKRTTEKLANICCNIIVNGNFDFYDKTDYLVHLE